MRTKWVLLFFGACALPLGHCYAQSLTSLRVTYSSISAASLVTWVAKDTGIFQKHGLDVGLVYIGGGTMAMSTTISGETQITQGAGTGSILGRLSGADTVIFFGYNAAESGRSSGYPWTSRSERQEIRYYPLWVTQRLWCAKISSDRKTRSGKGCPHYSDGRPSRNSEWNASRSDPGRGFILAIAQQSETSGLPRAEGPWSAGYQIPWDLLHDN